MYGENVHAEITGQQERVLVVTLVSPHYALRYGDGTISPFICRAR